MEKATYTDVAKTHPKENTKTPSTCPSGSEIMYRKLSRNEVVLSNAKKIIEIYPIEKRHIEKGRLDDVYLRVAEEFLEAKLAFKPEQIRDRKIKKVVKSKKEESKMMYVTFDGQEAVSQIFRRASDIRNNDIRVSNYVALQFYERYSSLQLKCKEVRKAAKELRTKVLLGD